MKYAITILAALSVLPLAAGAADAKPPPPPKTNLIDHSADQLIDEASARAIMGENIPAKVWKLYPANKFAFLSQVAGGITPAGTCVVTARVMLLTVTPATKAVLFRPQKTATAFDAKPTGGLDGCKAAAREKLKEATTAVVSALVSS
jgi:hypothetical protein